MKLATLLTACVLMFTAPAHAQDHQALTTCKADLTAAWAELLKPLVEGAEIESEREIYRTTLQTTESRIAAMDGIEGLSFCLGELDRMALRKANAAELQKLLKGVD